MSRTTPRRRAGPEPRGAGTGRRGWARQQRAEQARSRAEQQAVLDRDEQARRSADLRDPALVSAGGPRVDPTLLVAPTVNPQAHVGPTSAVPAPSGVGRRAQLWWTAACTLVVLAGLACLVARLVPVGPEWLGGVGSVAVVTAYTWALAVRTGGRPVVFGGLALLLGIVTLVLDEPFLRTGAAVLTCAVSAVLAVMATVPAVRFVQAARECVYAVLVAAVGALAVLGFAPVLRLMRFEYATLALGLVGAFVLVYRLGAGLHGLGRRGIAAVLVGALLLAGTLLYAEMLRRYGSAELVSALLDGVRWSRAHLGAFPRPIETVLGVPALAWGAHMRARRRQGWWVCAFGVAATVPVANALVNPAISLAESGLAVLYGLVAGLVIGFLVIRVDLALSGHSSGGGRRGRRAEEKAGAVRPEPARTAPLL